MHSMQQILDAYADAHGETLQAGYELGEPAWLAPARFAGSDLPW